MIVHMAASGETVTIAGLGGWPAAARLETFERDHGGKIPLASSAPWCRRRPTRGSPRSSASGR